LGLERFYLNMLFKVLCNTFIRVPFLVTIAMTKETQMDVMPQEVTDIEAITFGTTEPEGEIAPQSDEIIEMAPSEENL